jgi:hypothetical protein
MLSETCGEDSTECVNCGNKITRGMLVRKTDKGLVHTDCMPFVAAKSLVIASEIGAQQLEKQMEPLKNALLRLSEQIRLTTPETSNHILAKVSPHTPLINPEKSRPKMSFVINDDKTAKLAMKALAPFLALVREGNLKQEKPLTPEATNKAFILMLNFVNEFHNSSRVTYIG